jgi:hypothetical protein
MNILCFIYEGTFRIFLFLNSNHNGILILSRFVTGGGLDFPREPKDKVEVVEGGPLPGGVLVVLEPGLPGLAGLLVRLGSLKVDNPLKILGALELVILDLEALGFDMLDILLFDNCRMALDPADDEEPGLTLLVTDLPTEPKLICELISFVMELCLSLCDALERSFMLSLISFTIEPCCFCGWIFVVAILPDTQSGLLALEPM